MNSKNEEIEIDLWEILMLVLRHLPMVISVTIAGGLIVGLYSVYALTPKYTSTAKMYILTNSSTMISLSDLQVGSNLANDYEELITSRPVVEQVAENLDLDIAYEGLLGCVSVTKRENTRIIWIQVTYPDPVLAKEIANEFANVSQKRLTQIMQIDEPTIAEEAVEAKRPSSPNNKRNALLGAIIGLMLAVGFLVVRNILDDTMRSADDVEKFLRLNTLASIPEEGGTDNSEKKSRRKKLWGVRKGGHK